MIMPPKQKSYATGRVAVGEPPEAKAPPRKVPVRPSQPDAGVLAEAMEAAGVWQTNKRVNALWGTNEPRNSWVMIAGVGWKKLAADTDSSALALTVLASHGKLTQARVDYREESDGLIHELYVW
jgi:hypothetical protein